MTKSKKNARKLVRGEVGILGLRRAQGGMEGIPVMDLMLGEPMLVRYPTIIDPNWLPGHNH